MSTYYQAADEAHKKKERRKARELKTSNWWRHKLSQGLCYYCEEHFSSDDLTMDHKVPISRGGCSNKGNIVACCKTCNTEKAHRTPVEQILLSKEDEF